MATETRRLDFQQVRTRRVFEEICDQIRQLLNAGTLRPGDRLPAERDLALEFGVSRPAVREALRTLEISGVVSLQKGVKGGAYVRDGNPALLTQTLQDLVSLGRVSLRSLVEARALILDTVMRLACERASEEDFRKIEENISYIESSHDLDHRAAAGATFFRLIAEATRNEVLVMLVDSLGDIVRYVINRIGRKAWPELVEVRRRILAAMRKRNPGVAIKAIHEYLAVVHQIIDIDSGHSKRATPGVSAPARAASKRPSTSGDTKAASAARGAAKKSTPTRPAAKRVKRSAAL